ncbi:MAG: hypothetical protein JJ979_09765 [Roseibium sp.]|nr:hypothetical protein [Roseibium sp.]
MSDTSWEANIGLIRKFAFKVLRRARAANLRGIELDDIIQELSFPYLTAREKFDPELGYRFSTFLNRGMQLHINRWFDEQLRNDQQTPMSMDADIDTADGTATTAHDLMADQTEPADQLLAERQFLEALKTRLSERAVVFIRLLLNPPYEIYCEMNAMRARATMARERGGAQYPVPLNVTSSIIFDLMGADSVERAKIRKEIARKLERMTRGRITV